MTVRRLGARQPRSGRAALPAASPLGSEAIDDVAGSGATPSLDAAPRPRHSPVEACGSISPRLTLASSFAAIVLVAVSAVGCAAKRPGAVRAEAPAEGSVSPVPTPASPLEPPAVATFSVDGRAAFSVDGRVETSGTSRRLKLRFYAFAPDRFRMEIRGPVGGIALVATGEKGRVRIVLPSKRRYAEGSMEEDLGSGLIGMPLTGCDLAMVMRIASGMKRFQPCTSPQEAQAQQDEAPSDGLDAPSTDADRPGYIVDTSATGEDLIRYGFDWSGPGPFPNEVRVELAGTPASTLALRNFKSLAFPQRSPESLFWEPLPQGSERVPAADLAGNLPS